MALSRTLISLFSAWITWWRHQMETFSALLDICAGNSPVPCEFPAQRPVTRSFDVFFDLRLNKWLSKQPWGWWFETLLCPLWRHCNVLKSLLNSTTNTTITTDTELFSFCRIQLQPVLGRWSEAMMSWRHNNMEALSTSWALCVGQWCKKFMIIPLSWWSCWGGGGVCWFHSFHPSVHPSFMQCPLCGSLPISWIMFICGKNTKHEGMMCCWPFPGQ